MKTVRLVTKQKMETNCGIDYEGSRIHNKIPQTQGLKLRDLLPGSLDLGFWRLEAAVLGASSCWPGSL